MDVDPSTASAWLKVGKDGIDVVKKLVPLIPRPWRDDQEETDEDEAETALSRAFFGDPNGLRDFNGQLNGMIKTTFRPFLLRVGCRIAIPGDNRRQVRDAVLGKTVWDWTYVFDSENLVDVDKQHLRSVYFTKDGYPNPAVSTSVLKMTRSQLPDDLEYGVVICGICLESGDFDELNAISPELLIPTSALLCRAGEKPSYASIRDLVAARYWFERASEVVLQHEPEVMVRGGFNDRAFFDGDDSTKPLVEGFEGLLRF